ncbi:Uncharacterised protein [Neisseria animalis]|nr:Uncharacterised protein [Neisseria animalis]
MILRCFALPYYVSCLRLRCLVSFLFYSTIITTMYKHTAARNTSAKPLYCRITRHQTSHKTADRANSKNGRTCRFRSFVTPSSAKRSHSVSITVSSHRCRKPHEKPVTTAMQPYHYRVYPPGRRLTRRGIYPEYRRYFPPLIPETENAPACPLWYADSVRFRHSRPLAAHGVRRH